MGFMKASWETCDDQVTARVRPGNQDLEAKQQDSVFRWLQVGQDSGQLYCPVVIIRGMW